MGRSHAWVKRGEVLVDPRPMNWGNNLTMIGAIRADRWLTLSTDWHAAKRGAIRRLGGGSLGAEAARRRHRDHGYPLDAV
jgi:hypothetical protein